MAPKIKSTKVKVAEEVDTVRVGLRTKELFYAVTSCFISQILLAACMRHMMQCFFISLQAIKQTKA